MNLEVEIGYGTRRPWAPSAARIAAWARLAAGRRGRGSIAIRVVTPAESRRLNRVFRGKDRPTNVLSFPSGAAADRDLAPLGDVAICAAVVAREARSQRKARAAHWAHMVVHGVLHLKGYDHETKAEAAVMEAREREILAALGFPDPYSG